MRGPSRTAMLTAVARALHREEPPPLVLDDRYAMGFVGEDGSELRERLLREMAPDDLVAFSRFVCVRARFPEDIVEDAIDRDVHQYVILGAGLDSFAYRRTDLLDRLTVYEVDHPDTQTWKRTRLRELDMRPPNGLVFAPIDFERQTLSQGLDSAGFDFEAPAIFSWIGVTMYLSLDAIEATLGTIRCCPAGTRVVLTYNLPLEATRGIGASTAAVLARIADELGEPFLSLFLPDEIERLLRDLGFVDIVHFGPEEARSTYFSGRDDVQFGGAQRLIAATVAG